VLVRPRPASPSPYAAPTAGAPARPCGNCGTAAPDAYCPACGQEQRDYHRTLRGVVAELVENLAGWDGKVPTTLWLLVRYPGRLTAEFLSGRRARYLRPLRLYLTTSVLFFLTLAATVDERRADGVSVRFDDPAVAVGGAGRTRAAPADGAEPSRSPLDRWYRERKRVLKDMPRAERSRALRRSLQAKLPNMVFVLVPVFALLLRGVYRRRPVYYAEHLVFALHLHAFAMLALTGARLGRGWGAVAALVVLPAYLFVAMRRVYGGSPARTLLRLGALAGAYAVILMVAVGVTAVVAIAFL
jgi:hypothetical protein